MPKMAAETMNLTTGLPISNRKKIPFSTSNPSDNMGLMNKIQSALNWREFVAEFWGTLFLVMLGNGSVATMTLGEAPNYPQVYIPLTYGLSVALGILVSMNTSGGHINPAVTTSLAVSGKFPWKKVPVYFLAQMLGAFCASPLTYMTFFVEVFEGGHCPIDSGVFTQPSRVVAPITCLTAVLTASMATLMSTGSKPNAISIAMENDPAEEDLEPPLDFPSQGTGSFKALQNGFGQCLYQFLNTLSSLQISLSTSP
ncbi:unnamed protein product [Cyprideis torosa]|uniref:Uncharacterized protein n=1 Tax=Cyprideis torosa TaxID=163714 RepID=A0A7R8ZM31_9CRUS|nr:unnamed protein product [Cyprideis torosa]CAG0884941.1 unnamed protein product [Cyprideis torosa]